MLKLVTQEVAIEGLGFYCFLTLNLLFHQKVLYQVQLHTIALTANQFTKWEQAEKSGSCFELSYNSQHNKMSNSCSSINI